MDRRRPGDRVQELRERLRTRKNRSEGTIVDDDHCDNNSSEIDLEALIISAICDERPEYTLSQIWEAIPGNGISGTLDALQLVPLLVRCQHPTSQKILCYVTTSSPGKEVVIATQEATEHLIACLRSHDSEPGNSGGERNTAPRFVQLALLVNLYRCSIPQSSFRTKTPAEIMHSPLAQLETAIALAGPSFSAVEGRDMIRHVSHLVHDLMAWARQKENENYDERVSDIKSSEVIKSLLLKTVAVLAPHISAQLAQRKFESSNSRLVLHSAVSAEHEDGDDAMKKAVSAASALGLSNMDLLNECSLGALVILAHSSMDAISPNKLLSTLLPVLITSIQTHTALDESLSILCVALFPRESPDIALDADLLAPLCTVLVPLACVHPYPPTRHLTFRILSALLAASPPLLHMQLLRDLLVDDEYSLPQMRVAAVGLLKEAVVDALGRDILSSDPSRSTPFASPALLQTFGPIVFRPYPHNLFSGSLDMQEFLDTQEPRRLVECLAFYYVLLLRDKKNVTGIRDIHNIKSVEKELLVPLRSTLREWAESPGETQDGHVCMHLAALETALDRVDEALEVVKGT